MERWIGDIATGLAIANNSSIDLYRYWLKLGVVGQRYK